MVIEFAPTPQDNRSRFEKNIRIIMDTKVPERSITIENQAADEELRTFRNNLQLAVALNYAKYDEEKLAEWAQAYSVAYRKVYNDLISRNPNIFKDYRTIEDLVSGPLLDAIQTRLYKKN